ncbi:heparan-alpha-glucosaminide N-acetyltransferase domain-containing protein [Microbacterium sp. SSW1-59]|uniref:heparan-alpha-glucosaminide N-acetyltransferase domain-containing protein n=1 Tax=Microbacterium xanthum TaxID=3079794 RepID=UPI002AD1D9D9|nr:heparan-alpha-glucosaminide N-acetyltransferase domain-containing protein [Microbacterium sp. SSW1-59]MDZ8201848.1 heparan-alpha-glucosaminide N-acetyltransferase domain-containing protein [Microbacterium sp. SSW1-59]
MTASGPPDARARAWQLNAAGRIAGIDLARGLAVIGMLAAHLLWLGDSVVLSDPSTWSNIAAGRSSILFATLAGVSLGLLTGGAVPVSADRLALSRRRIAVRAALLWVLGMLLIATGVPVYVILPAYALLFLLALPALGLAAPVLFALAALVALVMPFVQVFLDDLTFWTTPLGEGAALAVGWQYPFPVWICFVLAGLGLARADLMRRATQIGAMVVGGALAIAAYGSNAVSGFEPGDEWTTYLGAVWTARPHSTGLLEVVGSGGLAIAVIGACVLACMWPGRTMSPVGWLALPIRAVGAMPLTAYTVQLVAWALIAAVVLGDPSDLAGFRDLDLFWILTASIVAGATAWALLVGRGPLEAATDRIARTLVPGRPPASGTSGDR